MTTDELKARTRHDSNIRSRKQIESLLKEAGELVAIMVASRNSAIGNRQSVIR